MEVVFILHSPEHPANIGASARAMKTMGHKTLRLISPLVSAVCEEAMVMAHGSREILEQAQIFPDYLSAVSDCDLVIATTARHRRFKLHYTDSDDLAGILADKASLIKKVAIIFGGERSGLPDSVVRASDIVCTLPTAQVYPSLNLSQSVMVFSYLLRSESTQLQTKDFRIKTDILSEIQYQHLVHGVMELVDLLDLQHTTVLKDHLRNALALVPLSQSNLIHELRKQIISKIKSEKSHQNISNHVSLGSYLEPSEGHGPEKTEIMKQTRLIEESARDHKPYG